MSHTTSMTSGNSAMSVSTTTELVPDSVRHIQHRAAMQCNLCRHERCVCVCVCNATVIILRMHGVMHEITMLYVCYVKHNNMSIRTIVFCDFLH